MVADFLDTWLLTTDSEGSITRTSGRDVGVFHFMCPIAPGRHARIVHISSECNMI